MIETTKSESSSVEQAIAHFLAAGESDPEYASNANRLDRRVDQPELQEIQADAIAGPQWLETHSGWLRGFESDTLFTRRPASKTPLTLTMSSALLN